MSKPMSATFAIAGARPRFAEKIHVGRPNVGSEDRLFSLLRGMIDQRWFTNAGPLVQEFERRVAMMLGVKHCIAMCNATVALEIAIRAAELKGEVIVPSFTFVATAHSLQWQEITPVFCDVDPATHNIDCKKIKELITPRTSGIIGVHLWGRPCAIDELQTFSDQRGLTLLFDAAHAFGCSYAGRRIGCFGKAEVLSFHATKFLKCCEGGAIVTNDDNLAARVRLMKNFGFSGYDNVIYIGTNGKMNEMSAAMGLTNLESVDAFIAANRVNFEIYRRELNGIPGLFMVKYAEEDTPNYHYVVCEVDVEQTLLSRDDLIAVLHAENVLARRYFYPGVHRMEPYRSYYPHARLLLPETERLARRILVLPTGTSVAPSDIEIICGILRSAIANAPGISAFLRSKR
jgi:dTDP-4-amino-4,6-dideoxygalactose transaminase